MGRMPDPGEDIAARVREGTLDATGALEAVAGLITPEEDPDAAKEAERLRKHEEESRRMRVRALGTRLLTLAREQVSLRQPTEERWYSDVRQFNGQYDPGTFPDDESGEAPYGSRVFVPLTRRLVGLCEARLFDMLFPSDERNYMIEPTPVPEMDEGAELADKLPPDHALSTPEGPQVQAGDVQAAIKELIEEAKRRADSMQREIDDQLAECKYPTHARNAIHDTVLLGTGVMKGPFPLYKTSKRWSAVDAGQGYTLTMDRRPVPVALRVDPWNFFPDMSSTTIDECEFAFERHFLTKRQLSELKNMPDVDEDALREVLGNQPTVQADNHRERLRAINGANGARDKRYEVWEYHGPLEAEDLLDCGCEVGDVDEYGETKIDPLQQYTGIVWFCEGVVIKAALNPLDTNELPFRVFCWQKDESNIFGFGMPYEVRDQQISANSANRAMLDNMGLCVKPQTIIDETKIEPMNGRWDIEPGKFWRAKSTGADTSKAITFVDLESRLQELQAIFATNKALIEEVGTMPAFLQGQDAPSKIQSATEASISWTAANLWVRRCVRNWDDDIVSPMITSFYDWNMQHSPKKEIKGDSKVRALGIAALVELEGSAQRMQQFVMAAKAMGVPISSQLMMLRQFARAFKLDPDTVLPTEQEIAKMKAAEEKAGPPVDIEQKKLEVAQENNQLDARTAEMQANVKIQELAQRERDGQRRMDIVLNQIAADMHMTRDDLARRYGIEEAKVVLNHEDKAADRAHEAQMQNARIAVHAQTGEVVR